jgi:hypothetical protein
LLPPKPGKQEPIRSANEGSLNAVNGSERNVTVIRPSPSTRAHHGREVINIDSYVPYFFASINN